MRLISLKLRWIDQTMGRNSDEASPLVLTDSFEKFWNNLLCCCGKFGEDPE